MLTLLSIPQKLLKVTPQIRQWDDDTLLQTKNKAVLGKP
jgi:hypothetical protein